ncbi:hypothetical protein [Vreelandella profundi]|uniref:hypothetical protein n=1 Tax=Vreelandella profundi TaxID=2852117 RepID=UPI001EEF8260|nr:hypothetical protein [Halomonas profundi]
MLKPPITLPIAPSSYWLSAQCCLFIGVAALSYWVGGTLVLMLVSALGGIALWRAYTQAPKGLLCLSSTGSSCHGRWLLPFDPEPPMNSRPSLGDEYQVRCDYLGPWLIGLYVGKQRIWLWPDSAPPERLREVRRLFHRPGR